MVKLTCSAEQCSHNAQGCCALNSIDVSGGQSKQNTCCESFCTSSGATNCSCGAPTEDTSVACDATDCAHNEHCQCNANSIHICTCGGGCTCSDTECESFEKR